MFTFKDKFPQWEDFPNGLQVLVVDEDLNILNEIKDKLERCQYVVSAFTKGEDALSALRDSQYSFHVALVEAMTGDGLVGFKILEAARPLPTILMSSTENMAIMMQGIALGAADFLQKPLSDEKLRNIWQHVVRKAFISGDPMLMDSIEPVKASVEAMFSLSSRPAVAVKNEPAANCNSDGEQDKEESGEASLPVTVQSSLSGADADTAALGWAREILHAPDTTQLGKAVKVNLEEEDASAKSDDCPRAKTEGDDMEAADSAVFATNSEAKSCLDLQSDDPPRPYGLDELDEQVGGYSTVVKLELLDDSLSDTGLRNGIVVDGDCGPRDELNPCLVLPIIGSPIDSLVAVNAGEAHDTEIGEEEALLLAEVAKAGSEFLERPVTLKCSNVKSVDCSTGHKKNDPVESEISGKVNKVISGRRKMKVDWTPELHRRFVQAVEQLGVEKAIPSRILELMGVQCLTRHNIASHLQKYRSHRRHLLAREAEAATWQHRKPLDPSVLARNRRDGTAWPSPHHTNPPPIQPRPPFALTPIQPHPGPHCHLMGPPLHIWSHPNSDLTGAHVWQQLHVTTPTTWQASDGLHWQYPCVDAWGHPTPGPGTSCFSQPYGIPFSSIPALASPITNATLATDCFLADESMRTPMYSNAPDDPDLTVAAGAAAISKPSDFHPPKEILDAAISEALANPWTPLPLGLKPPSMDGVMAELLRQGINTVPS